MRTRQAIGPLSVTKANTRSVVAASRRAKAMRSGSYVKLERPSLDSQGPGGRPRLGGDTCGFF